MCVEGEISKNLRKSMCGVSGMCVCRCLCACVGVCVCVCRCLGVCV